MAGGMTKSEREELRRLVNERARLARQSIEQRQAELLANTEEQLAQIYKINEEGWAEV